MASTPEGKVKAQIKAWLKKLLAWQFAPVSNGMGRHGIPDHIVCLPVIITPEMVGQRIGRFVAIEAKAGKGKPTPRQLIELAAIREAGGIAMVVNEERIERMKEVLVLLQGAEYARWRS